MELTNRTIQGRFLLRPSKDRSEIVLGVMGRAQRHDEVELFGISVLSTHYQNLARCARELPRGGKGKAAVVAAVNLEGDANPRPPSTAVPEPAGDG